ncbi:hypothetical protein KKJ17_01995 [Xenorhabdus bovienii]|uniref:Uncharacterized protein n=1 Tax=Xenorhabdus bovienii TaxID=40576 RepID=A0AAJ1JCY6_XENBV|nr:hypothetical protein [Xenorhabdus bovienii]MDE1480277.1 hypothetical protein [Xenorhabdus bovienii]MDE1487592.1 hypothetical protein [Xenorhabdus bovienii]MDE9478469.1 hypothetical protein [Xenorhabdus bovienii]MDE9511947.1 hypothetical protein [Xenorhabdus bovienii]MDE9516543.1 hypothetical protein [Xenorhabdus bovienii]
MGSGTERGACHRRAEHVASSCNNSTQPRSATHCLTHHGTVNLNRHAENF